MQFKKILKEDNFVITTDIVGVKGTDISKRLSSLKSVKGIVHGVNATDMPSARLQVGSLAISVKVKELGFEPILQMTCRDRNRLSLQSELLSAYLLGINNILALRGDDLERTDQPGTKAVFDLDSPELIGAARSMEKGQDLAGNPLSDSPTFCVGAALDPGNENLGAEIEKAWKKVEAGTEFFQTQPIFNIETFITFLDKLGNIRVPILGGVFLLTSAKMARFFNQNIPGITVPEDIISQLEKGDPIENSINITASLTRELRKICSGVHIMMVTDWHNYIPEILDRAGIQAIEKSP